MAKKKKEKVQLIETIQFQDLKDSSLDSLHTSLVEASVEQ